MVPLLLWPCVNGLGEIILGFYFLRGGIVQGFVKALGVPPMHPPQGGKLDFADRRPRAVRMDKFSLIETVDRLRQRVVIRIANGADTRLDPGFS